MLKPECLNPKKKLCRDSKKVVVVVLKLQVVIRKRDDE